MKKKVLMIACWGLNPCGVPTVIMSIIRNMSNDYVFDIVLKTKKIGFYEKEFLSYGGHIYRIDREIKNNLLQKIHSYLNRIFRVQEKKISKIIKKNDYDIIHSHDDLLNAYSMNAAKKNGVKIRISHFHTIYSKPRFFLNKLLQKREKKEVIKNSTSIIGCSTSSIASHLGFNKIIHSVIINNSFDESKFAFQENKPNNLSMLQVGTFSDNKNQLFSLDILAGLVKLVPKYNPKLLFVGFEMEPLYKKKIEKKIQDLNLGSYVTFLDRNTSPTYYYSLSSYLLFPSKQEGFGIVLLEAQSAGLTCFASSSITTETNAGGVIFLPLDNKNEWVEAIAKEYSKNKGGRNKYCLTNYSMVEIMKKYEKIYHGQ